MEDFDFINAFADVNTLQVVAVGHVVGSFFGALFSGMIEAGLSEENANRIIENSIYKTIEQILANTNE